MRRFVCESHLSAAPEAVFAFHERPDALARLVPPWERVEVLQPPRSLAEDVASPPAGWSVPT